MAPRLGGAQGHLLALPLRSKLEAPLASAPQEPRGHWGPLWAHHGLRITGSMVSATQQGASPTTENQPMTILSPLEQFNILSVYDFP